LEEKSICGELGYFLGAGDRDNFEEEILADEATGDGFTLF